MRRVITAPEAARPFREAWQWLLQDGSGPVALARWHALRNAPRRLAHHPYSGRQDENHPALRVLVVSSFRIPYRVHLESPGDPAGDVMILAVFGPGQA